VSSLCAILYALCMRATKSTLFSSTCHFFQTNWFLLNFDWVVYRYFHPNWWFNSRIPLRYFDLRLTCLFRSLITSANKLVHISRNTGPILSATVAVHSEINHKIVPFIVQAQASDLFERCITTEQVSCTFYLRYPSFKIVKKFSETFVKTPDMVFLRTDL